MKAKFNYDKETQLLAIDVEGKYKPSGAISGWGWELGHAEEELSRTL